MKKFIFAMLLFAATLVSAGGVDKFFINKCNCDRVIHNKQFDVCYDYKLKSAKYVSYTLRGNNVNSRNIQLKYRPFRSDTRLKKEYRSYSSDYKRSGFDRGHLANDASFDYNYKVLKKTYIMSNIVPQYHLTNAYMWANAEQYGRELAVAMGKINVLNGVVFPENPKRIGKHKIAVPSGFWKMFYNDSGTFRECYYYLNIRESKVLVDSLAQHKVGCSSLLFNN